MKHYQGMAGLDTYSLMFEGSSDTDHGYLQMCRRGTVNVI